MNPAAHTGPAMRGPAAQATPDAAHEGRARRQQRAMVAQRLRSRAADTVASLNWDALDAAPGWLALSDGALQRFEAQVGALLCAPMLKLWIDGPRLGAARAALGAAFLQALRALPSTQMLPSNVAPCPRIDSAEQVTLQLRGAGASVLLASMQPGTLRSVVAAAMASATPAAMAAPLAQSLIARTVALAAQPGSGT